MTKRVAASIALSLVSGAALLGLMFTPFAGRSDDVLANGYGRALADVDTVWAQAPAANIWLSQHGEPSPTLRKPVVMGDRISVGSHARADVYEVVGLEHIDGEGLGLPALRIQVVTARIDSRPPSETVRFLFAVEAPVAPSPPPPDKVL